MAALASAGNVYNACLHILRNKGFELWVQEDGVDSEGAAIITYFAKKGEYDFAAPNPIELMGLVGIYEYINPSDPPNHYWWSINGGNIHDELFEKAFGDQ